MWKKVVATVALASVLVGSQVSANPSGLLWYSGAKAGECLPKLTGRPLGGIHVHVAPKPGGFPEIVHSIDAWVARAVLATPAGSGNLVSIALLPEANKGQFVPCLNGEFDDSWRHIGQTIAGWEARGRHTFVELGWEPQIGSDSHPWGVDTAAQVPLWRACFQRAATAIRAGGQGFEVSLSFAKSFQNAPAPADVFDPGPAYYDVVGSLSYDRPAVRTAAGFADRLTESRAGSPYGLEAWRQWAAKRGKGLIVPEWGVWSVPDQSVEVADDPAYIDGMWAFFRRNAGQGAGRLKGEWYQNNGPPGDAHGLCYSTHPTPFPNAAAAYARDWQK